MASMRNRSRDLVGYSRPRLSASASSSRSQLALTGLTRGRRSWPHPPRRRAIAARCRVSDTPATFGLREASIESQCAG